MTPCEQLGYKIGDKFIVTNGMCSTFALHTVVELYEDDGSDAPLFKGKTTGNWRAADGKEGAYAKLDYVSKYDPDCTGGAESNQILPQSSLINGKLEAIKASRARVAELKTELQKEVSALQTLTEAVANQMQEYGLAVTELPLFTEETSETLKPLVITNWWDLQEGDIIIARGETWNYDNRDQRVIVDMIEHPEYSGSLPICITEGDWGQDFEFVSRPSKTNKS